MFTLHALNMAIPRLNFLGATHVLERGCTRVDPDKNGRKGKDVGKSIQYCELKILGGGKSENFKEFNYIRRGAILEA